MASRLQARVALGGAVSGDFGRSWQVIRTRLFVSPPCRLLRLDPHGRTLECLHQLPAGRSADLARARAGLKKCSHRFPEICSRRASESRYLSYAEEPVVLQGPGPGVPGADWFHAVGREEFEFLKLAMVNFEPGNALKSVHRSCPHKVRDAAALSAAYRLALSCEGLVSSTSWLDSALSRSPQVQGHPRKTVHGDVAR